ncbi:MAG: hypothetical protein R3C59_20465 [Planctomycetaceae bacterium]
MSSRCFPIAVLAVVCTGCCIPPLPRFLPPGQICLTPVPIYRPINAISGGGFAASSLNLYGPGLPPAAGYGPAAPMFSRPWPTGPAGGHPGYGPPRVPARKWRLAERHGGREKSRETGQCRCAKCRNRGRHPAHISQGQEPCCSDCECCDGGMNGDWCCSDCFGDCCGDVASSCHDGCGEGLYSPMSDHYGLGLPQHQGVPYEWSDPYAASSGCHCEDQTVYGSPNSNMLNAMPIDAGDDGAIPGRSIREVVPMPEIPPEPAPAAEPRDLNLPPATTALRPVSHWVAVPVETMSVNNQFHQKDSSVRQISTKVEEPFRIEPIELPAAQVKLRPLHQCASQ